MAAPIFLVRPELIAALFKDIAQLLVDGAPSPAVLEGAPFLDRWSIGIPRSRGLHGYVHGHPRISDGIVETSAAMIIGTDRDWVRTMSRYYRLGTPADQ